MAESATFSLNNHPDISKLLDLFKMPGYESEHREYSALLDYVEKIENRYTSILDELTTLREQISGITDKKNPINIIAEHISSVVFGIGEKIKALKDSIVEFTQNTLSATKDKSLSAVGAASGFLHIKDGLQSVSNALGRAAATIGTLEQFHKDIKTAHEESAENEPPPQVNEESISLSDLLQKIPLDFESQGTDELKRNYEKLLGIGMDNDLTANELTCLQYLTEEAEKLLPERGANEYEQVAEIETEQGAEI